MRRLISLTSAAALILSVAAAADLFAQNGQSNGRQGGSDELVLVKQGGKWGYADKAGTIVIEPQFYGGHKFQEGFAAVCTDAGAPSKVGFIDEHGVGTNVPAPRKWGFIDQTGTLVIPPQFEGVGDFSEGLAAATYEIPFSNTDSWGYIDKTGKIVIKPQFSRAAGFSEGLALVWAGGIPLTDPVEKSFVKMGYIDKTGRWIIHSRFLYYFYDEFSEGLVPFRKESSKWGYMDRKGKIVIKPKFNWAGPFSGGVAPALIGENCIHIDKKGKTVGPPQPENTGSPSDTRGRRFEQDRHGVFVTRPRVPPCS